MTLSGGGSGVNVCHICFYMHLNLCSNTNLMLFNVSIYCIELLYWTKPAMLTLYVSESYILEL